MCYYEGLWAPRCSYEGLYGEPGANFRFYDDGFKLDIKMFYPELYYSRGLSDEWHKSFNIEDEAEIVKAFNELSETELSDGTKVAVDKRFVWMYVWNDDGTNPAKLRFWKNTVFREIMSHFAVPVDTAA